ncbi:MAG TPA: hypothetical protein VFP63_05995 [Dehalococcoidia bacterium]|nr:hypothetical protein [Dehalococcoidia bacterium]
MTHSLERAIARFRPQPSPASDIAGRVSAAAFRAMALERLRAVERDVAELKTRVNGLIFVVIGAVVTQLVLRAAL